MPFQGRIGVETQHTGASDPSFGWAAQIKSPRICLLGVWRFSNVFQGSFFKLSLAAPWGAPNGKVHSDLQQAPSALIVIHALKGSTWYAAFFLACSPGTLNSKWKQIVPAPEPFLKDVRRSQATSFHQGFLAVASTRHGERGQRELFQPFLLLKIGNSILRHHMVMFETACC